jgi:hypothetical protein
MTLELGRTRVLPFEQLRSSTPVPFLVVVFWLSIIFASFGLFAPRNATAIAAFSSGAIFLIFDDSHS